MPNRGAKPKAKKRPAPKATKATVSPPSHLSPAEKDVFRAMAAKLAARGVLDLTDPTMIELYAVNYILLGQAREALAVDGLTSSTRFGSLAAHPMLLVVNQATVRLKGLLNDMGLTPASARLSQSPAAKANEDDPWEGLLNVVG